MPASEGRDRKRVAQAAVFRRDFIPAQRLDSISAGGQVGREAFHGTGAHRKFRNVANEVPVVWV